MLRAGFDVDFENEQDGSSTHCECTATSKITDRKFSVEAKHREPEEVSDTAKGRFRMGKRLHNALRKRAVHDRIVFVDINVPDVATDLEIPGFLAKALSHLRRFEGRLMHGEPLPPAYLFITNFPFHHNLEGSAYRSSVMAEGFQIPDFKNDSQFRDLHHALEAREVHADMHRLVASIREHTHVPSTFDGEIPEFAFGKTGRRLLIGQPYLVKNREGVEHFAKLTAATVVEAEKAACCAFAFDTGETIIINVPLSDSELHAYKQYPDTFFGVLTSAHQALQSRLELYDFLFAAYSQTPKERLLELMVDAPDLDHLKTLSQKELASIYCERCVHAMHLRP
jgi:hypothetical protein